MRFHVVHSILEEYKIKRYHRNDHNGHKNIGCVIFRNNNIISYGYNFYNTNKFHKSIHAEHDAILKLKKSKKNKKVNVLIFRISNSYKNVMSCLPCDDCKRKLKFDIEKKGYCLNKIFCTNVNDNNELNFTVLRKTDL